MYILVVFTCFLLIPPCEAEPGSRKASLDPTSHSRLIASGGTQQGFYRAGVEIILKPGALTYWRQPGDAGVPPLFSFDGSENLANAEVLYPAPSRIREDEGEAFGYRDRVVFPLHVTPRDMARPVVLKLTADYAVCETICIPVKSHMELTLPLAPGQSQDAEITAAEASVPVRLTDSETSGKLSVVSEVKAQNPTWDLTWKDAAPASDLFAEAPAGWYFETKPTATAGMFKIVAVEAPKTDAAAPVSVTLTLTGLNRSADEARNIEFSIQLTRVKPGL